MDPIRLFFSRWKQGFLKGFKARPGRTWAGRPIETDFGLAEDLRAESERFVLVPLKQDDAPAVRALTDHPAITNAISFLQSPFTLAAAMRLAATNVSDEDAFMGVRRRADHALVGITGVHFRGEKTVEIGYWMGTAYHNQGYASEAVGALIARLDQIQPGRQVFAECAPENAASVRVLWKLGFVQTDKPGARPGRIVYAKRPARS